MNRIIDFTLSDEESVVSRILIQVHKAVDQHFPDAEAASRQFTKTVFSEEESESTAMLKPIPQEASEFAHEESTKEITVGSDDHIEAQKSLTSEKASSPSSHSKVRSELEEVSDTQNKSDWFSNVMIVLLFAGLIMLAYVIYSGV